jgi:hypothetical protein
VPQPAKLSAPALETLAIISYRQPIGRGEVEDIRGVGSSSALKTLIDRGLVEVVGRGEGLGRPLLYGTSNKFLEHFGFRSLEDLPRPDELPVVLRSRPVSPAVEPLNEEQALGIEVEGNGRPVDVAVLATVEASSNGAGPEPTLVEAEFDVVPETENPPAQPDYEGQPE